MDAKTSIRVCQEQRAKSEAELQELYAKIKTKLDDPTVPEGEKEKLRAKLTNLHGLKSSKTPPLKCAAEPKITLEAPKEERQG
jgi:hypothetical protein